MRATGELNLGSSSLRHFILVIGHSGHAVGLQRQS
jgi:hypothetical protein